MDDLDTFAGLTTFLSWGFSYFFAFPSSETYYLDAVGNLLGKSLAYYFWDFKISDYVYLIVFGIFGITIYAASIYSTFLLVSRIEK